MLQKTSKCNYFEWWNRRASPAITQNEHHQLARLPADRNLEHTSLRFSKAARLFLMLSHNSPALFPTRSQHSQALGIRRPLVDYRESAV